MKKDKVVINMDRHRKDRDKKEEEKIISRIIKASKNLGW